VVDDDVCAVTQHIRLDADRGDEARVAFRDAHLFHRRDRFRQARAKGCCRRRRLVGELVVATLEGGIALCDQDALVRVANALDVDAQAEAVEQLRS